MLLKVLAQMLYFRHQLVHLSFTCKVLFDKHSLHTHAKTLLSQPLESPPETLLSQLAFGSSGAEECALRAHVNARKDYYIHLTAEQ